MKLDNIRVAPKLWGMVIGLLILMLIAAAFTQNRASVAMVSAIEHSQRSEEKITRLMRWRGLTEVVIERTMASISVTDEAASKVLQDRTLADQARIVELQDLIGKDLQSDQERQAYEKVLKDREQAKALLSKLPEIKASGDVALSLAFAQQQFAPVANRLLASLDEFIKVEQASSEAAIEAMQDARRNIAVIAILAAVLLLAVAVTLTLLLIHSIVHPLQQTIAVAKAISEGDLTQNIQSHRQDEFGDLLRAFSQMSDRLRSLVSEVRAGVDSVSIASKEIANGNMDLSSRTEQTAASLEETAASMEELTGNVVQSAETARQANQLALNATQAASRGGEVMGSVVTSMQHISDSSRRISDIIGVIDGIAFQTNILALNAAVEAARAGEQGRGFAVVASEVRNLAHRSAEAAKEIKSLIQRSVESVESGSQQVSEAGAAMQDIVMGVQRVGDLIAEISAAAGEQQQGISQVNQAVGRLDQMTQQNAALVEESAAAASSLSDQANKLGEVLSQFKVGGMSASFGGSGSQAPKFTSSVSEYGATPDALTALSSRRLGTGAASALKVEPTSSSPAKSLTPVMPKTPLQSPPSTPAPVPKATVDDQDWETF